MRYLLQIYADSTVAERLAPDELDALVREYEAIGQHPAIVSGAQLQAAETATTVRVEGDQTLLTDGPFVEAKEYLGGFFILEADELDTALELAARVPAARMGGAVEVRPLMER